MAETRYKKLALLFLLGFAVPPVHAETQNTEKLDVDAVSKNWKCKYCPDLSEEQWEGYINLDLGYISNGSYKFGEYNGLNEKGPYLKGDLNALYRDEEGNYWNIGAENLGLDSSYFGVEGGRQGKYKLNLEVDQITRNFLDTSRTPYSGDSTQTLPVGWVSAPTTGGFTTLNNDLRDVNFSTRRRHVKLGGEYIASARWSYEAWFKRQTKAGNQPTAFSFGFNRSAILPQPIDYTTDDLEFKAKYKNADFNGQVALSYSDFRSASDAFRWDNAYDTPTGAPQGQAGTAPDNTRQQILVTGNYMGIDKVQLTGLISYARLEQDEAYLPYTLNSNLTPPPLPQNSLNGKVAVFNTNLAAHWQYSPQQTWRFVYEHHEQVNETARNTYTYVTTDSAVTGTPRANFPYSFRNQKLRVSTDYRFANKTRLSGGGKLYLFDRTYQSVEHTQEASLWAKFKHRINDTLQYSIKTEYNDRRIDNYNIVSEVIPADNPLMRKYNMADRKGYKADFNLEYSLTDALLFNFSSDIAQYDYDATTIGLIGSDEFSVGLDVQYMVDENLAFNAFIQNTKIRSLQAGSQSYSTADWYADNNDNVLTFGLGTSYRVIQDKLKVGADYVHANSSAAIDISVGGPFPSLTTRRDTIVLYADYNIDEKFTMRANYQYEQYNESNWYIDGVAPDTLANVLTLGETAPSYKIGAVWLSLRYIF
ncbi:MAG: MtrB/PioB family decaheme-associated outer membrane protein [Acidiferrobacterales bacterium]